MLKFEEFPSGDDFWMVKCIDRFRLPHAASESASVDVRLQRIDPHVAERAARAQPAEIQAIFGSAGRPDGAFQTASVHVGSLPALRVGQIFHRREFKAELRATFKTLDLPNAEKSAEPWDLTSQMGTGPEGWKPELPYAILRPREFDLGEADLRAHQVLTVRAKAGQDVVIPRTVIFQCFYGPHSEMADAVTSGPWDEIKKRLVSTADFENGLQTRDARETNEWHLVLETLVPNAFRWHVALPYFDPYAQIQARKLYSEAEAQRRRRKDRSWFCTATLPFNPDFPLRLRVKGYSLAPSTWRPEGAFLVTAILAAKPFQPLPLLAYGRANDGHDAPDVIEVDAPKPHGGRGSRPFEGSDRRSVTSLVAPPTNSAVAQYVGDSFDWGDGLRDRLLVKTSSKHYTGNRLPLPQPGSGPDSTAKPVSGGEAGRSAQVTTPVRPPIQHFANLITCLHALRASAFLSDFHIVPSSNVDLRTMRDGLHLWDFTEREVARGQARPKRRWRMIPTRDNSDSFTRGRTMLVAELAWEGHGALLFEVECRPSEPGYLMGALVFEATANFSRQAVIEQMLQAIVKAEGRHLGAVAAQVAAGCADVSSAAFRHHYIKAKGNKRLDPDSLKMFLKRNEPATVRARAAKAAATNPGGAG